MGSLGNPALTRQRDEVKGELKTLSREKVVASSVARERLLNAALALLEEETCPVCDTEWDLEKLRNVISGKLKHLEQVALKRKGIERCIELLTPSLRAARQSLHVIERHAILLKPQPDVSALTHLRTSLDTHLGALDSFLPINDAITALDSAFEVPEKVVSQIQKLDDAIKALPEPSKQDAAKAYLIVAQEKLEALQFVIGLPHQSAARQLKKAETEAALSRKIYDVYAEVSTSVLDGIYKEVQNDFTELYKFINEEDEGGFDARLMPSIGKLGFDVDFYGRGYFRPVLITVRVTKMVWDFVCTLP